MELADRYQVARNAGRTGRATGQAGAASENHRVLSAERERAGHRSEEINGPQGKDNRMGSGPDRPVGWGSFENERREFQARVAKLATDIEHAEFFTRPRRLHSPSTIPPTRET